MGRTVQSRLADGSISPANIGWTMIRLEGQTFPTRVIFAEEDQPSLLGMVSLEEALLAVDSAGQRLAPVGKPGTTITSHRKNGSSSTPTTATPPPT